MNYLLLAGTAVIGFTDARRHLVPNIVVLPMFFLALAGKVLEGREAALHALLSGAAFFFLGYVIFLIGGMGGGDVKLMAVLGVWHGLWATYSIMILATFIGLAWGIVKYLRAGILKERAAGFLRGIYLKALGTRGDVGWEKLPGDPDAPAPATAIPFGTCLALSVLAREVVGLV